MGNERSLFAIYLFVFLARLALPEQSAKSFCYLANTFTMMINISTCYSPGPESPFMLTPAQTAWLSSGLNHMVHTIDTIRRRIIKYMQCRSDKIVSFRNVLDSTSPNFQPFLCFRLHRQYGQIEPRLQKSILSRHNLHY